MKAQLMFVLAWFHAVVQERRSYIPQVCVSREDVCVCMSVCVCMCVCVCVCVCVCEESSLGLSVGMRSLCSIMLTRCNAMVQKGRAYISHTCVLIV